MLLIIQYLKHMPFTRAYQQQRCKIWPWSAAEEPFEEIDDTSQGIWSTHHHKHDCDQRISLKIKVHK